MLDQNALKHVALVLLSLLSFTAEAGTLKTSCEVRCADASACALSEPAASAVTQIIAPAHLNQLIVRSVQEEDRSKSVYEVNLMVLGQTVLSALGELKPAAEITGLAAPLHAALQQVDPAAIQSALEQIRRWDLLSAHPSLVQALQQVNCTCRTDAVHGRQAHCEY